MSNLSPEIEQYIQSQLAVGAFKDREELLEEALRYWKRRQEDRQFVQQEVKLGIEDSERGRTIPGEDLLDRLERKAQTIADEPRRQ